MCPNSTSEKKFETSAEWTSALCPKGSVTQPPRPHFAYRGVSTEDASLGCRWIRVRSASLYSHENVTSQGPCRARDTWAPRHTEDFHRPLTSEVELSTRATMMGPRRGCGYRVPFALTALLLASLLASTAAAASPPPRVACPPGSSTTRTSTTLTPAIPVLPAGPSPFDLTGCSMAIESPSYALAQQHGGKPSGVSLPFCGAVVDYPIMRGNEAGHRQEDDGMRTLFGAIWSAFMVGRCRLTPVFHS